MLRTHPAGDPCTDLAGSIATPTGWVGCRRDHGGVILIDMRDRLGYARAMFHNGEVAEYTHHLRSEYYIQVTGTVEEYPEGSKDPNLAPGRVEVNVTELAVLNESAALPFQLEDVGTPGTVGEGARLKYRYSDLRHEDPAKIIRFRTAASHAARKMLNSYSFTEIETPTLTRSTPGGARGSVVSIRLKSGTFYALPQSPQLFKQLLIVAGMERYYQIARYYRDEDFHVDHQSEFTQLDVKMSFAKQDDVIALAEEVLVVIFVETGVTVQTPISHMTFKGAMEKYGPDKPDLHSGAPLVECTEFFEDTAFRAFQNNYVGVVMMDGGASQPCRQLDAWQDWARQRDAKGLAYTLVGEDGTLDGSVAKNITDAECGGIAAHVGVEPGDCIFFAAGDAKSSHALLGAAHGEIVKKLGLIKEGSWVFAWVVDVPLFEPVADATISDDVALGHSRWTAVYHVFTSPKPGHMDTFGKDPGNALAYVYGIARNGNEIGSSSTRTHCPNVQGRIFDVIGIGEKEAQGQFGFLLDAFQYDAPPYGGIVSGWDRIVFLLAGVGFTREVIIFSKSGSGADPLIDAPTPIIVQQRKETGTDFRPKPRPRADGTEAIADVGDNKQTKKSHYEECDLPLQPGRRGRDQFLLAETVWATTRHPYHLTETDSLKGHSMEYSDDAAAKVGSVVKDAKTLLSARFGGTPVLSGPGVLIGQPNALVVHVRVAINPFMQERTVVVKQAPRTTDDVDPAVLREVMAYQFTNTLPDDVRPGPQFLAYDVSEQLLVLSDIGVMETSADVLFHGDEKRRLRAFRSLGASPGRVHTHTHTREEGFETLRRRMWVKNKVNHEVLGARDHGIVLGIRFGIRAIEGSGIPVPDAVRSFGENAVRRTEKSTRRAFTPLDLAPDNILLVDKVQSLDYEWVGYRDVIFDMASAVAGSLLYILVERPSEAEVDVLVHAWMEEICDHWYRGTSDRRLMAFTAAALFGRFLISTAVSFFGSPKRALWVGYKGRTNLKPKVGGSTLERRDMANMACVIAQFTHKREDGRADELERFARAVADPLGEEEGQGTRDGSE